MIHSTLLFIAMATSGIAIKASLVEHTQRVLSGLESHLLLEETCQEIASSISTASEVYDIGSLLYRYCPMLPRSNMMLDGSIGGLPRRYQSLGIVEYPARSVLIRTWYTRRCRCCGERAPINSCLFRDQGGCIQLRILGQTQTPFAVRYRLARGGTPMRFN